MEMNRVRLGVGITAVLAFGLTASFAWTNAGGDGTKHRGATNVSASFGQWMSSSVDRFPNNSPRFQNHHEVIPYQSRIKAGSSLTFAVAGLHQVIVYGDGTQPEDIDTASTVPGTAIPVPLIADADNRRFRGLDPTLQPQDRVEVVRFLEPGRYLLVCGVLSHFAQDGMYGFVTVLPDDAA